MSLDSFILSAPFIGRGGIEKLPLSIDWGIRLMACVCVLHAMSVFFLPVFVSPKHP